MGNYNISVKCDERFYCLSTIVDGEEQDGPIVPYGERATLDLDTGELFTCVMPEPPEDDKDYKPAEVFTVDEISQLKPADVKEEEVIFDKALTRALEALQDVVDPRPIQIDAPRPT